MAPKKSETKAPAKKATGAKKPVSGYMLFCKTERPKVVSDLPDATFGEVGKELGKRWKGLSDSEKAEFKKVRVCCADQTCSCRSSVKMKGARRETM